MPCRTIGSGPRVRDTPGVGKPHPQAVSDTLEIVFDTLSSSRKAPNLRRNPKVALGA